MIPDKKLRISIFAGILFLLISSPQVYKLTSQVLGNWIANGAGCPNPHGLLLHTIVFILVTRLSMNY